MLWIYYAFIKTNTYLLITINSLGCVIEIIYITMYIMYATKSVRIYTTKIICLIDVGLFGLIIVATYFFADGSKRLTLLGWICVGFSVSVFVAPLSIMRVVIRTKSVEFMPFSLSFFLTLSAVAWFSYGLFTQDIFIAIPNTLGFVFGVAQMVLYVIYMDMGHRSTEKKGVVVEHVADIRKPSSTPDLELVAEHIVDISKLDSTPNLDFQEIPEAEENKSEDDVKVYNGTSDDERSLNPDV